jgi:hypothetical protein
VPTVLVSYNWKPGTPRYLKAARFVENLFARMDRLHSPGFDPKWKEIDLSVSAITACPAAWERHRRELVACHPHN